MPISSGLLDRVKAREEAAARELVDRLYPLVSSIIHANLPRRDDPEDLAQEVFLKVFGRLDQFRGAVPFRHWVSRIALTTCLDRLRRQKARPELRWTDLSEAEQAVFETLEAGQPAESVDAPQALGLLERLLSELPAADAWLLRQIELEQKSLADVCASAGWNAGATRVRLFRARRRLQAAFRKLEAHPRNTTPPTRSPRSQS